MDNKPKYYNDARNKASQRYNAAHMEIVTCRAYKRECINDRLAIAAKLRATTKAGYMLDAIRQRLDADGVTLASIASPADDPPTKSGGEP